MIFCKLKAVSLASLFILSLSACGGDSGSATKHYYDQPYQCFLEHTSQKSGKVYRTAYLYHPEKNWVLMLSAINKKSFIKVANLFTNEGRYDGSYKGVFPEIKRLKFATLWPSAKINPSEANLYNLSKIQKSDCSPLQDSSSLFSLIDLASLSDAQVMGE